MDHEVGDMVWRAGDIITADDLGDIGISANDDEPLSADKVNEAAGTTIAYAGRPVYADDLNSISP